MAYGGQENPNTTQQNTCACEKVKVNTFIKGWIETSEKHMELIVMLEW